MKLRDLALAAVVSLAFAALLSAPAFQRLQGLSVDILYAVRDRLVDPRHDPADSPTVIIAIDEETYQTEPFEGVPRVLWTQQIADILGATLDAGAAVVGFDIVFSTSAEPVVRRFDKKLRKALKRGADEGKVILGERPDPDRPIRPSFGFAHAVGGCAIRALTVLVDDDRVVRHVPLVFTATEDAACATDGYVPSLSLDMAARLTGTPWSIDDTGTVRLPGAAAAGIPAGRDRGLADGRLPDGVRNNLSVNFDKGPASIPTYPLVDLHRCLESDAAAAKAYFAEHFAGKAVVLGTVLDQEDRKLTGLRFAGRHGGPHRPATCALDPDRSLTRYRPHRTIPGVYIQAAAVNNLVRGEALHELEPLPAAATTAGFAFLAGLLVVATGPAAAGAGAAALAAAWTAAAVAAFIAGWVLPLLTPIVAAGATVSALFGYRFAVTNRGERHIRKAFGHFLAPAIVEQLAKDGRMPEQGGELREMTVWISDLANYSTLSEKLDAPQVVTFLNEVYTVMSDTVEEHGGFVAQFVGDAVVAAFGAPRDDPDHAHHAVESALHCAARVAELGQRIDNLPAGMTLGIRIGVSTGPLVVGNIGSKRRLSYSIVGDDINLSSRLEGVNKIYGSTILVNEATRKLCRPDLIFREVDTVRVKGRDTPVRIFEPLGRDGAVSDARRADTAAFEAALADYRGRRFGEALAAFEALADRDPVARTYAGRAREMLADPPPDDWDGVFNMLTK